MADLKKILKIVFFLIPLFCVGCGQKKETELSSRKKILCTIAQIGNLVSEIGGERIEVQVLVRGELNPHSYELVKGDDEKIQQADRVFYNGLGLEHGASLAAMVESHPRSFAVGDSIRSRSPEKILWVGNEIDPHIWMDVSLWSEAVDPIMHELIAIDPEGEVEYRSRAAALKEKMMSVDKEVFEKIQAIPSEKRFLVTSHDAFHYFARRYLADGQEADWEKRFKAPEGLSPDGQLNPIDLQKIIDHMSRYRIHVLFPESNVSRDSIRKIADGGKKLGLLIKISKEALYGDSLKGTYFDGMVHNADAICRSLQEHDDE